jgi:hypothetical protein
MSAPAAQTRRTYAFHEIPVTVTAADVAVLTAVDLRLKGFPATDAPASAGVAFEFLTLAADPLPAPGGASRAVYETRHGTLHYAVEADILHGQFGDVRLWCDAAAGLARIAAPAFEGQSLYIATHPLMTMALIEIMERRRLFCLHAACLANDAGTGVLVAGQSGAGKSTLTLALAHAGLTMLSDDIVFLAVEGASITARGFADALGLTDYATTRFHELAPFAAEPPAPGFPKRLHRIETLFGTEPISACTPRALVFPAVDRERPSALARLDPGEALLRLVPDVLLTEPAATQAHLAAIGAVLSQVTCYELRSGPDLERAASLVLEAL